MTTPEQKPPLGAVTRPRQPSRPGIVTPDQPERGAVRHSGVDGSAQALPPHRKPTLQGLGAVRPSGEYAPTLPVPAGPPLKKTWRLPTPPSAVALARRTPVPPPDDPSTGDEPAMSRSEAREAILADELAKARQRIAELEPRARGAEEATHATYPPKVERRQSPVPSSAPAKVDQAIGTSVRYLLGKAAPFLLAAAGIGGGITAVAKPSADPAKADAMLASQEAMRADVALLREQVAGMLKREAARDMYTSCLEESLDEVGEQLLPAQDRLTNASPLRAYVKRCKRLRP